MSLLLHEFLSESVHVKYEKDFTSSEPEHLSLMNGKWFQVNKQQIYVFLRSPISLWRATTSLCAYGFHFNKNNIENVFLLISSATIILNFIRLMSMRIKRTVYK